MNKSLVFTLWITFFLGKNLIAQESFLKLDSIVVKEGELDLLTQTGYPYYSSGEDTVMINVASGQYVKVRKTSLTIRSSSAVSITSELQDLWLGTSSNNYVDLITSALLWESPYPTSGHAFRTDVISSKTFKIESFPDEFILNSTPVFIVYRNRNVVWNVYYRMELLYFSVQ